MIKAALAVAALGIGMLGCGSSTSSSQVASPCSGDHTCAVVLVSTAQACAPPTVHVTHNTTSTSAHIVRNPCHKWWVWAWGSFKDSNGALVRRSSKGQKSGTPVIEDDSSVQNVLGGYGFSGPGGVIRNRQTYG